MGLGSQGHSPAALPLEGDLVPIVQEADWASGLLWTAHKISPQPGFDPRTAQPVANRYTD